MVQRPGNWKMTDITTATIESLQLKLTQETAAKQRYYDMLVSSRKEIKQLQDTIKFIQNNMVEPTARRK